MSSPPRSRFTFRRRLLEVLIVLWIIAYLGERIQERWPPPAATPSAAPASVATPAPAATPPR